jgi:HSP20 family protein
MALIRFAQIDPARHMLTLQEELDRFLRNPSFNFGLSGHGAYPSVNIFDDHEGVVIIAELPGLDPASINVAGQGNTVTIGGMRAREDEDQGRGYHRRERRYGEFSRSLQLAPGLDIAKAEARYVAGVLTLRIPKAEETKPRQITVQTA